MIRQTGFFRRNFGGLKIGGEFGYRRRLEGLFSTTAALKCSK